MSNALNSFTKSLVKHLKQPGVVKADLLRKIGISRTTLLAYENGAAPTLDMADKIANFFGQSLGEFIGDTPNPHTVKDCLRVVSQNVLNIKGETDS